MTATSWSASGPGGPLRPDAAAVLDVPPAAWTADDVTESVALLGAADRDELGAPLARARGVVLAELLRTQRALHWSEQRGAAASAEVAEVRDRLDAERADARAELAELAAIRERAGQVLRSPFRTAAERSAARYVLEGTQ